MSEWKPIESAPKDGTVFLATDGLHFSGALWTNPSWADKPFLYTMGCSAWDHETEISDYDGSIDFSPTHWMELPEPPK